MTAHTLRKKSNSPYARKNINYIIYCSFNLLTSSRATGARRKSSLMISDEGKAAHRTTAGKFALLWHETRSPATFIIFFDIGSFLQGNSNVCCCVTAWV